MSTNPDWAAEAKERWGDTEPYAQAARRTKSYTPEDTARIKAELDAIESDFAEAMAEGVPADDPLAKALAERARMHIHRWYYDCPPRMHVGLAQMYVTDPRFKAHYDDRAEGLAEYVKAAVEANAGV